MVLLDNNGFYKNTKQTIDLVDDEGLYDLMSQKFKTEKWYILFFPMHGFDFLLKEMEDRFYNPKSDRNKGFELSVLFDRNTILVMAYKEWMNPITFKALLDEVMEYKDEAFNEIPKDKDIVMFRYKGETQAEFNPRWNIFNGFNRYMAIKRMKSK